MLSALQTCVSPHAILKRQQFPYLLNVLERKLSVRWNEEKRKLIKQADLWVNSWSEQQEYERQVHVGEYYYFFPKKKFGKESNLA